MSINLLPFPAFRHLPFGSVVGELPVTRDGVSAVPQPGFVTSDNAFAHLKIQHRSNGQVSNGICGLLPYHYFLDGTIRPHEQTLHGRLKVQEDLVRSDGGALGKPVLLTVPSLKGWWAGMNEIHEQGAEALDFIGKQNHYELREYLLKSVLAEVNDEAYPLPAPPALQGPVCIADGHHRAETHALLGEAGVEGFAYVPVCIIGADELTIGAFARLINDGQTLEQLLPALAGFFHCEPLDHPLAPTAPGQWLLQRNDLCYRLYRKDAADAAVIDAVWLEHTVLPAVFGITDTRTDQRIHFEPVGNTPDGQLDYTCPTGETCLVGFPLPTETFFAEIEAGRLLPPKSTRFEPRVPSGLVVWVP